MYFIFQETNTEFLIRHFNVKKHFFSICTIFYYNSYYTKEREIDISVKPMSIE